MNLWCQEQQAVLAAGNTPFPRNLVLMPAWERWQMKVVGENGYKSLQKRKIIFTPWAPFIKVNYTACNISSPFHVRAKAYQLQWDMDSTDTAWPVGVLNATTNVTTKRSQQKVKLSGIFGLCIWFCGFPWAYRTYNCVQTNCHVTHL